jgi:hypothetical protein
MEGRSPREKTRLRVQRDFECSRIEQAVLAAAYQRILPDDRVSFTEHNLETFEPNARDSQRASQIDNTNCSSHFTSAIGGH